MSSKSLNNKILFGLKVKQLRLQQGLSFAKLAASSGVSVSYINEIEKGKKYPKPNKIESLANALGVTSEELSSKELPQTLAPIAELLQSNFLNELPLDLFGIELAKVVELIANAPLRVGAFISTLVEISRNYALREDHFYFAALRAYQELNYNHFETIEQAALDFANQHKLSLHGAIPLDRLEAILKNKFAYTIISDGLKQYPEFKNMRSLFMPNQKKLLFNGSINEMQRAYQLGKEIGFNFLNLKGRSLTSSLLRVDNFDTVLTHAHAAYFSVALLINRNSFITDLTAFFQTTAWDATAFLDLMKKYNAAPEMLFQRLTNVIPSHFGIKKLFFLRILHNPKSDVFEIDKELHLHSKHHPHSNGLKEHYCRRWMSLGLLKELHAKQTDGKSIDPIVDIQRSSYHGTDDEYLCITLARPANPHSKYNVSLTLGMIIDDDLRAQINFLDDPAIKQKEVHTTCERCSIQDCKERVVSAKVLERKQKKKEMLNSLKRIEEL